MTSDDVDAATQAIARMETNGGIDAWRLGGEFCGVRWAERDRILKAFHDWYYANLSGEPYESLEKFCERMKGTP